MKIKEKNVIRGNHQKYRKLPQKDMHVQMNIRAYQSEKSKYLITYLQYTEKLERKMKKLICYGDSNTYGYDPRSFIGERYPNDIRWPDVVAEAIDANLINMGQNGRIIPTKDAVIRDVDYICEYTDTESLILIMIGTNNILSGEGTGAGIKLSTFLSELLSRVNSNQVLLIAPAVLKSGSWVDSPEQIIDSKKYAKEVVQIAEKLGIRYVDLSLYDIPILFDGVHFSEAGHMQIAQIIKTEISLAQNK